MAEKRSRLSRSDKLKHAGTAGAGERLALLVLVAVLVVMGLILADDFGISTDEVLNAQIGELALKSYFNPQAFLDYLKYGSVLAHHGPSHFMVMALSSELMPRVMTSWTAADGRHFANFLAYLVGVASFYFLMRRLVPVSPALQATMLYALQPLIFGHAFINQKDTPFLGAFLASLALGLKAVDLRAAVPPGSTQEIRQLAREDWRAAPRRGRILALACAIGLAASLLLLFAMSPLLTFAKQIVTQAYDGVALAPIQAAFDRIAQDAHKTPLEAYLMKTSWAYGLGRALVFALLLLVVTLAVRRVAPRSRMTAWRLWGAALLASAAAGCLMGFTVSIRPIGAFAGALVSLYWVYRLRSRAYGALGLYWLAGAILAYGTWPYLWPGPVERMLESLGFAANFPTHTTLYGGRIVSSDALPWDYFPMLVAAGLTEPILPLALMGALVAIGWARKHRLDVGVLWILFVWMAVPLLGLYGFGMGIYGNIRQLLFVLPALFFLCGLAFAWLAEKLGRPWVTWAILMILLIPGIHGLISLHPYEYTYFNSFVGGPRGAAGIYEQDRFCTSYREAMDYVNEHASSGDTVIVFGAPQAASPYARPDLEVVASDRVQVDQGTFILTCKFWLGKEFGEYGFRKVFVVERDGAALAEVHQRGIGD